MNAKSKWTLALLTLLSGSAVAQNCKSLVYIGKPVKIFEAYSLPIPVSLLIGTVTLAAPLEADGVATVMPIAWDFSSEDPSLNAIAFASTNLNPAGTTTVFSFTTKDGAIIDWDMQLYYRSASMDMQVTSSPLSFDNIDKQATQRGEFSIVASESTSPGTWSCLAPLVDPLTAHVTMLTTQVATLTAQVAPLKSEVSSIIAERNEAEAAEELMSNEYVMSLAQLKAANVEIAALKAEIEALKKK
jgi:hypothetical protein